MSTFLRAAGPRPVLESGLTESDWVPTVLRTMEARFPDVYAIGDGGEVPDQSE